MSSPNSASVASHAREPRRQLTRGKSLGRTHSWKPRGMVPSTGGISLSSEFVFQRIPPLRVAARRITSNPLFEFAVFLAISASMVSMAMEDMPAQRANIPSHINDVAVIIDYVVLVLFTVEFVLRVLSQGLMPFPPWVPAILRPDPRIRIQRVETTPKAPPSVLNVLQASRVILNAQSEVDVDTLEESQGQYYFKSNWNRLDFAVLVISFLSTLVNRSSPGLSSLRSLRALRPLRMIHFIGPLQIILRSLWRALRTLLNVLICLCFLYIVFALLGQQIFQGSLRRNCVIPEGADAVRFNLSSPRFATEWAMLTQSVTAIPTNYSVFQPNTFCSFESAPKSFQCGDLGIITPVTVSTADGDAVVNVPLICADIGVNPSSNLVSFDSIGSALWAVFLMSSLQVRYIWVCARVCLCACVLCVSAVECVSAVGVCVCVCV